MPSNHPLSILIRANGVRKLARGIIGRWRTLPPPFCAPGEMDIDGRILNSSENHGSRVYRNRASKRSMQNQVYSPSTRRPPCCARMSRGRKKNVTSWKVSRGPLSSLPANGFPREDLPFCWATGGAARVPEAVPSKRGHQLNAKRQAQVPRRYCNCFTGDVVHYQEWPYPTLIALPPPRQCIPGISCGVLRIPRPAFVAVSSCPWAKLHNHTRHIPATRLRERVQMK